MGKKLKTWRRRSQFEYEGSVAQGTKILYGKKPYSANVSAEQYQALLKYFKGAEAEMGTSFDAPPDASVGGWLQENVTKTALASYVGPILLHEGYAERVPRQPSRIRFL
jgi:hypothetical protein